MNMTSRRRTALAIAVLIVGLAATIYLVVFGPSERSFDVATPTVTEQSR